MHVKCYAARVELNDDQLWEYKEKNKLCHLPTNSKSTYNTVNPHTSVRLHICISASPGKVEIHFQVIYTVVVSAAVDLEL